MLCNETVMQEYYQGWAQVLLYLSPFSCALVQVRNFMLFFQ